jgi:hypothetical protein
MKIYLAFISIFLGFVFLSNGQKDSSKTSYTKPDSLAVGQKVSNDLKISPDSLLKLKKAANKLRDPRRASLLAAVFPGAGQLYNKKYWKLPIVWGGTFALGYYIRLNNENYGIFRNEYLLIQNGKQNTTGYNAEQLVRLREYWRRNRDFLIIISALTYLLNIADAAVDAHFSSFDVSDDLSLNWKPELFLAGRQPIVGLGLALNFK